MAQEIIKQKNLQYTKQVKSLKYVIVILHKQSYYLSVPVNVGGF